MGLDELDDDVTAAYSELGEELAVELDRETRNELAMLGAALGVDDGELLRRGVHMLFQSAVETGTLDFHLRSEYDVTYDEYLMGVTMDTYEERQGFPQPDTSDDRRYQF